MITRVTRGVGAPGKLWTGDAPHLPPSFAAAAGRVAPTREKDAGGMKIRYTLDLDDVARRALAAHCGEKAPIDRRKARLWLDGLVTSVLQEIVYEYERGLTDSPGEPPGRKEEGLKMDPNGCLNRIADLLRRSADDPEAGEELDWACQDLYDWIARGGCEPDWTRHKSAASYYRCREVSHSRGERMPTE